MSAFYDLNEFNWFHVAMNGLGLSARRRIVSAAERQLRETQQRDNSERNKHAMTMNVTSRKQTVMTTTQNKETQRRDKFERNKHAMNVTSKK